ncbi:MAG: radical SAM protein [Desulfobacterales bacterium]|nr:radical SAM protein [Desulfobacterales bacterium]
MKYEGPIYRPPSEADSLLVQATVGCPYNRCTFCMVYKNGPAYRVRQVVDIKADMREAAERHGETVRALFFPAGNTIAMKTADLSEICRFAWKIFPNLRRITVYGSAQYICRKGPEGMRQLAEAGLTRIHVGLESGDDEILQRVKKGADSRQQVEAGQITMAVGIELSLYVVLGIGGKARTGDHVRETVRVLNQISPDFIRLRTFVPKKDTPLLEDVLSGDFQMLGPHEVLTETAGIVKGLTVDSVLASDHYTNYINVEGKLPAAKGKMLAQIEDALQKSEDRFRPFFIGDQ